MPKRSNEFQRLVYLVKVNLADDAKVTESKMLRDRVTKGFREVDVVIEGTVGSLPVVVSIECRDHKRVADVAWVDAMKTKHERLATNALFLASRSGFTPEARRVAEGYGIGVFTLEDVEGTDFAAILGSDGTLWHKSWTLSAGKVSVRVAATPELPAETVATSPDNLLYLQDGTEIGPIKDLVEVLLKSARTRDYLGNHGREDHRSFELVWANPRTHDELPLYLRMLEPNVLREIESIRVAGPCKVEIGSFAMRMGRIGDVHVAWGRTTILGRDAMVVATSSATGEQKLSINFAGAVRQES